MSSRFFVEHEITSRATLTGTEAHHLLHVMRAKVSDEVTLFDGHGAEFAATITDTRRSEVDLDIVERREIDRELPFELTLGVAMPKGDRQKQLVEKLTELGATRLTPLVTERSVAELKASALDKLRRTVIEASKQCGRNCLMEITAPTNFAEFVESGSDSARRLLAHPSGRTIDSATPPGNTVAAIGPEGGFSDREAALAMERGWHSVALGPRILRIETAALAIATAFSR